MPSGSIIMVLLSGRLISVGRERQVKQSEGRVRGRSNVVCCCDFRSSSGDCIGISLGSIQPGSQKYVKQWLKTFKKSQEGKCSAQFWDPGSEVEGPTALGLALFFLFRFRRFEV